MKHKWSELITDPSSGQWSMSRTCFGAIVLAIFAVTGGEVAGYKLGGAADLLKQALLITGGLYGANSVAGAITNKPCTQAEQPPTTTTGPVG